MAQAAPPEMPSQAGTENCGDPCDFPRALGSLRDIRVAVQEISRIAAAVVDYNGQLGEAQRAEALSARLGQVGPRVSALLELCDERLKELEEIFARSPAIYGFIGDEAMKIRLDVENIQQTWPPSDAASSDAVSACTQLGDLCDNVVYSVALLTLPSRLQQHLSTQRVGGAFDFKKAFDDELSGDDQVTRMLDYLATHPDAVQGVVDPSSGMIYHTSPKRSFRVFTYLLPAGFAIVGALLVVAAAQFGDWFNLGGWPTDFNNGHDVLATYLLVMVGALAHLAVERVKQLKASGGPLIVLGDVLAWLHLRYLNISASVVWVIIGTVGARLTDPGNWQTAFFVGFALDSTGGIFIDRFLTYANTQVTQLTKTG